MSDEKLFTSYFKESEIRKNKEKLGISNDLRKNKEVQVEKRSLDKLDSSGLLIIQEFVEDYVRKETKNQTGIFKDPNKAENKNTIIKYIDDGISNYKEKTNTYITQEHEKEIRQNVWYELIGFGPLEPALQDQSITEIMVVNANKTYIEKSGSLILSDIKFKDYDHIKRIIDRIIAPIGRKIDEQSPIVDARLPQGFRLNTVISPIALSGGLFVTIRKFPTKVWTPQDLINFGSAPPEVFDFLELCVKARKNIFVSGGTGSGKTTLLNVLSNCIPPKERIITIEDTAELKLVGDHILSEEARPANAEGKGAITIRDLVKTALRQRPDRIVVGECRGAEALDMLQAMNTGHDGSMSTGHANSPRDLMSRLEYMCMCAGDMPLEAIRPQIASALSVIVQIGRVKINGKPARKTLEIVEVLNEFDKNGDYVLKPIFDSKFKGSGKHEIAPTGYIPTFADELVEDFNFNIHALDKPEVYVEPHL